ncbi:MAG: DUF4836 family protein [Sodaliphilus sp.]
MIPSDSYGVVRIDVNSLLTKGQLTDADQKIVIPQSLKDVVNEYDSSPFSKAIELGKRIGIDTDGSIYCFFPKHTFRIATLLAIEDSNAAKSEIEKRTGQKFQSIEGVDFLREVSVSYVMDDDYLFVGEEVKETADANLALMARSILHASEPGIDQNADACEVIHHESDVNVYLSMKGIQKTIAQSEAFAEKLKKFPIATLFTDSDIKAIALHLNFENEGAKLEANIKADANSDYMKLFDATLAKADAGFLKVMPVSMNYIFSISVKGESLLQLSQVKKSINLISNMPSADQLDIRSMIRSIDGPVAIGFSPGDGMNISSIANDNWNIAIAAKSGNAPEIVSQIVAFASSLGQEDFVKNGRHLFDYEGMPVYLGEQDGYVYAIRLDHEMEEEFYYDMPDAKERFAKSQIGFYAKYPDPKGDAFFNVGLNNSTSGEGVYYTIREENPVVSFLELLCHIHPSDDNSNF